MNDQEGYRPTLLATAPNPELRFDTLVPCRVNDFLVEVARVVASGEPRKDVYNPLYVYAESGLGKTHLLSAIADAAVPRRAVLTNAADLEAEIELAQRDAARALLRRWLAMADVLLIDDVQSCEGREELQRELFAAINLAVRQGASVVISSDVPPTRLRSIETRLLARLGSGAILSMQLGDRKERAAIIRQSIAGAELSEEVIAYLAEHVTDSVRRLKAAATQLVVTQDRIGRAADVELARAIVPLPCDLTSACGSGVRDAVPPAERFRRMLQGAETQAEQVLALQIAIGQQVRHLRATNAESPAIARLERALASLRSGDTMEALRAVALDMTAAPERCRSDEGEGRWPNGSQS